MIGLKRGQIGLLNDLAHLDRSGGDVGGGAVAMLLASL